MPSRGYERWGTWSRTGAAALGPLVALLLGAPESHAANPAPLRVPRAAVASDHPAASAAGVELLRAGGNAADAACATALALGVVNPQASGIGGGGFALVYVAKERKVHALDFRERAPMSIRPEMFIRDGKADVQLSQRGGLAVAVPGEVRGLAELVKRFGKRGFAACVAPAERLATRGFPASPRLALALARAEPTATTPPDDKARSFLGQIFGRPSPGAAGPVKAGDRLTRPALARTLRRLRQGGPDAFYSGAIALEIVKAVKEAGGVLLPEDLRRYTVATREPISIDFRGYRVFSMPPPSSGGIVLAQVLGIMAEKLKDPSRLDRRGSGYLHLLTEALKHGFADRARLLGDPDFVKVPSDKLLDPAYHRALAARIDDRRVLPSKDYGLASAGAQLPSDGGTAHLSVIDAEGNAVSLTTTVNTWFGAHVLAGETGIVLNNEMDDFSLSPGTPNTFGLVGTAQNAVAPGKRPLSSMTPTIVLDGDQVKLVVGGAGGPAIITGTVQVLLHVLDGKLDVQAASATPRIHHQWEPATLYYEGDIPRDVIENLERRGHKTKLRDPATPSLINVVGRTADGLEAAAELRSGGAPAGY